MLQFENISILNPTFQEILPPTQVHILSPLTLTEHTRQDDQRGKIYQRNQPAHHFIWLRALRTFGRRVFASPQNRAWQKALLVVKVMGSYQKRKKWRIWWCSVGPIFMKATHESG